MLGERADTQRNLSRSLGRLPGPHRRRYSLAAGAAPGERWAPVSPAREHVLEIDLVLFDSGKRTYTRLTRGRRFPRPAPGTHARAGDRTEERSLPQAPVRGI